MSFPVPSHVLKNAQVLATDVDDTLTIGHHIPGENLTLIARLRRAGMKVLLVTGRTAGHGLSMTTWVDLDGAIAHWDDLKKWVFVYNVRRGIPPDVPKILKKKQKQYPKIAVVHLSSVGLWEIARILALQQRTEDLGAPTGVASAAHFSAEPVVTAQVRMTSRGANAVQRPTAT